MFMRLLPVLGATCALILVVGCGAPVLPPPDDGQGDGSGTIGPDGGLLYGPDVPGVEDQPRVIVRVFEGQLATDTSLQLAADDQVSDLPTDAIPLGEPYRVDLGGASATAAQSIGSTQWTFTYTLSEVGTAGVPSYNRDGLILWLWSAVSQAWLQVDGSQSVSNETVTSVFATLDVSTGDVLRVGLPGASGTTVGPDGGLVYGPSIPALPDQPRLIVSIPAGQLVDPVALSLTETTGSDALPTHAVPVGSPFRLDVVSGTDPGTVPQTEWTFTYSDAEVTSAGIPQDKIDNLFIFMWDDVHGRWLPVLGSTSDSASGLTSIYSTFTAPTGTPLRIGLAGPPPVPSTENGVCVIGFDDANSTDWSQAFQTMFIDNGMRGTCYLQSDRLDTGFASTSPQYRQMVAAGWHMGNHTVSGTLFDLPTVTVDTVLNEFVGPAQTAIEAALDYSPTTFAAPSGVFGVSPADEKAKAAALLGRFEVIRGTNGTYYQPPIQDLTLDQAQPYVGTGWIHSWSVRSTVPETITLAKHLVDLAVQNKGLAMLHTHAIQDAAGPWDMTPSDFRDLIDYIAASGVAVATVDQVPYLQWSSSAPIMADGGFDAMADLWPALGSAWPADPQSNRYDFYFPYRPSSATQVSIDTIEGHDAPGCVRIEANGSFVYLEQRLALEANTTYRVTGWIKVDGVVGTGAVLTGLGPNSAELMAPASPVSGTQGWTEVEGTFSTGSAAAAVLSDVELWLELDASAGTAWFDDITAEPIS